MDGAKALFNGNLHQAFVSNDKARSERGGTQFLAVSGHGDRIQLHESLRPLFGPASAHLRRCGLAPTTQVVWHQGPVRMRRNEVYVPCMFDEEFAPLGIENAPWALNWQAALESASLKSVFPGFMARNGFSGFTPETLVFYPGDTIVIPDDFEGWVKDAFETTGGVNVKGPFKGDALRRAAQRFVRRCRVVQVQRHVPGKDYSNQYYLDDEGVHFLGTTVQVVVNGHHAGNESSPRDFGPVTHPMMDLLHEAGLRGFAGGDLRGNTTALVSEWNLRVNGSSIPEYLRHKFNFPSVYLIRETPVNPNLSPNQVFRRLEEHGLEFSPEKGGTIAYLWGWLQSGHTIGLASFGDDPRAQHERAAQVLMAA
jgi:hypothetical protein